LEHKDGYWVKCSWCGKNSYRYKVRKKRKDNFCNRKCFTEWSRSSRNKNWKGDNYPENFRLRRSGKYKKWRIEVFKRDNYTCQICGVIGKNLTADHIKSWALYPKLRFTLSNGRTLCKSCHYKTDTWGLKSVYQQLGTYPKN
jgi:5-methylcytosine-specific restriction endonuclease McrA